MRETHAAKPHAYCNALLTHEEGYCQRKFYLRVESSFCEYFGFCLLHPVIGAKKKKHAPLSANQMRTNTNRFMNSLFVVTLSSDWLLVKYFFTLIGCYDNFGLRFTTLKALRSPNMKTFGIAIDVMSVRNHYVQ